MDFIYKGESLSKYICLNIIEKFEIYFTDKKNNYVKRELNQEMQKNPDSDIQNSLYFRVENDCNPFIFDNLIPPLEDNTTILNEKWCKKYIIDHSSNDWKSIYNYLYYEINIHVIQYINYLHYQLKDQKFIYFANDEKFLITNFIITKFEKSTINPNKINNIIFDTKFNSYSVMVFIWILNDIENEIVFLDNYKVKTDIGKLFIFPCFWSFPFNDINITDDKYMIIGHIEIVK